MKDPVKPCIRENNPNHIIILVNINDLTFETTPERITKSIVDVHQSRKLFSDHTWGCTTQRQHKQKDNTIQSETSSQSSMVKEGEIDYIDHKTYKS